MNCEDHPDVYPYPKSYSDYRYNPTWKVTRAKVFYNKKKSPLFSLEHPDGGDPFDYCPGAFARLEETLGSYGK